MVYTAIPKEVKNSKGIVRHSGDTSNRSGSGSDNSGTPSTLLAADVESTSRTSSDDSLSMSTISFSCNGSAAGGVDEHNLDAMNRSEIYDFSRPVTIIGDDCDDMSSQSSGSTDVLEQISMLKERLRVQEVTKVELLNQCVILQKKSVESEQHPPAYMNILRQENKQLKATIQEIELNFVNDMKEIVEKMKKMNADLASRDEQVALLEEELNLLGCGELYLDTAYKSRRERLKARVGSLGN